MTCTEPPQKLPRVAYSIQRANLEHLSSIAELIALCFYPPEHWLHWFRRLLQLGIYNDLCLRYHHSIEHSIYFMVLAPIQDRLKLLGSLEVSQRLLPGRGKSHPYLSNLAVHPDYRRQGIGRALLLAAEDWLKEQRCDRVYLHVLAMNHPARFLYHQLGYSQESTIPAWFFPDKLLLSKFLRSSPRS
ncbi:GNAT family N-acetyltransferase [Candidatus Synechococcus calcipolaris G9]|uniref:GNAT family N-acetyltransferase n=1 Tax=Candidatus Synechococcus calcipolaris G9 TaxID=1497997 RepID=A0ABT6EXE4_9SYNE|nr:GNAT family N-acetyltransferase [Candidatus Synechococcus calcipolaris]MDG2990464.1 GNAT family N-acetyltransferase [Candidatus Synechococcus calcipolaris G9]